MEQNQPNNDKQANQTPDEAKKSVKDKVAKGVATVAGVLEGFAEQAKKDDLPQTTKEAVKKAGETTRQTAETTRDEGRKVMDSIKGGSSSSQGGGQSGSQGGSQLGGSGSTQSSGNMGIGSSGGGSSQTGGLGRTAARPDSPGVMRRSEGHARSATAELERSESEPTDVQATSKTDKTTDLERR